MTNPFIWAELTAAGLAGLVVVTCAMLKGWREWIALQRLSIEGRGPVEGGAAPGPMARIEIADLKERVRKLEAIAAGVDL
jgi:hypothetical protein